MNVVFLPDVDEVGFVVVVVAVILGEALPTLFLGFVVDDDDAAAAFPAVDPFFGPNPDPAPPPFFFVSRYCWNCAYISCS